MTGKSAAAGDAGHHIVVMGVAGCGKSTVGTAIAERLGVDFLDGDALHPQSNIEKMASGTPLNDNDREPWLTEVGRRFSAADAGLVIACSALKRAYRDIIRSGDSSVVFVYLEGARELLFERLSSRPGHFMPVSLLDSQLATLEALQQDEAAVVVDASRPLDQVVREVLRFLPSAGEPNYQRSSPP